MGDSQMNESIRLALDGSLLPFEGFRRRPTATATLVNSSRNTYKTLSHASISFSFTHPFDQLPLTPTHIPFHKMLAGAAIRRALATSSPRFFSSSAARQTKVAVLGAGGGIGQPLSLLLKSDPLVTSLSLYDIRGAPGVAADVSHIDTGSEVCFFKKKEKTLSLAAKFINRTRF